MVFSDILVLIGFIILVFGSWGGIFLVLLGGGLEFLNRIWVMGKCRQECELLAYTVCGALQGEVTRKPALAALRLSVGAYGTYLRFGFRQPGY